jgi:ubiquinone/menaquinone biosynthesis C-methylase UbiE
MSRFLTAYDGAPPPWDIGRPQPAIVALESGGLIQGPVLDVGCGTGENALFLAEHGHEVHGVDIVPRAIEIAREKAESRGLPATFSVGDVLTLETLGRTFRGAIDSGVFHVFDDAERIRYVHSLARAIEPAGVLHVLVFSDREPADWGGPRRIRRQELEAAFTRARGWAVRTIVEVRFHALHLPEGGFGWRATVDRAG